MNNGTLSEDSPKLFLHDKVDFKPISLFRIVKGDSKNL